MKDKTVGANKKASDDFDLDSFLAENNFLADESKSDCGTQNSPPRRDAQKNPSGRGAQGRGVQEREAKGREVQKRNVQEREAQGRGIQEHEAQNSPPKRDAAQTRPTKPRAASRKGRTGTQKNVKVAASARTKSKAARSKAAAFRPKLKTLANPADFHKSEYDDSTYKIRGGGKKHNRLNIVLVAVSGLVLVGAVAAVIYMAWTVNNSMKAPSDAPVITLTAEQTRAAIDSGSPRVLDVVGGSAADAYNSSVEQGWNVFLNENVPIEGSTLPLGGSVIKLDPSVSPDVLAGFYLSEDYDSYNYTQMQEYFNGSWYLNISHGDDGALAYLQYINFAATADGTDSALITELKRFKEAQGLNVDGSNTLMEYVDSFNNSIYQGTIMVGETKYFWRVSGIALDDYYEGDDNADLPDSAIFVKCTVSTFDWNNIEVAGSTGGTGIGGGLGNSGSSGAGGAGGASGGTSDDSSGGTDDLGGISDESGTLDE